MIFYGALFLSASHAKAQSCPDLFAPQKTAGNRAIYRMTNIPAAQFGRFYPFTQLNLSELAGKKLLDAGCGGCSAVAASAEKVVTPFFRCDAP